MNFDVSTVCCNFRFIIPYTVYLKQFKKKKKKKQSFSKNMSSCHFLLIVLVIESS